MLLKPTEIEYVELEEELEDDLDEKSESESESPYIKGPTILLGGTAEPVFIEDEFSFLLSNQNDSFDGDEDDEFVLSVKPIILGGEYSYAEDEYSSEDDFQVESEFLNDDFEEIYGDAPEYASDENFEQNLEEELEHTDWQKTKHTTLIGKVDTKLLGKIKEYRESVREMSEEKLSSLSSGEDRNRLLMEAAQFESNPLLEGNEVGQIISELDKKLATMIEKYTQIQKNALLQAREDMLKEVEEEVENQIISHIEIIKEEASEHIEETVQYYKKKLEADNKLLSDANNIISRREQILDDAYNKTLSVLDEAEEESVRIIEKSSQAHEEAELIITEFEKSGEEIREQMQSEADRIISDANVESARIIQAAEDQHQEIVDAATQDGFSVGYQEGKEEALKENSELLAESLKALNKLYAAFPISVKQNEEKIILLSYQIAQTILTEPVKERPDLEQKIMNRAIKYISDLENVKIKVNPADLDLLLPKQEYFKLVIPEVHEFMILSDYNIPKNNCIITVKSEELNIAINTQISILEEVFNQALQEQEA
ncbi:MAG: FliH/SctL family protein [Candidatus Sericytochromatia bacterium]